MNFLILYKTGPELADLEVCDVILGKTAAEAEQALREAITKGPGQYIAVPFDAKAVIWRQTIR
jgi:hypothetical protein